MRKLGIILGSVFIIVILVGVVLIVPKHNTKEESKEETFDINLNDFVLLSYRTIPNYEIKGVYLSEPPRQIEYKPVFSFLSSFTVPRNSVRFVLVLEVKGCPYPREITIGSVDEPNDKYMSMNTVEPLKKPDISLDKIDTNKTKMCYSDTSIVLLPLYGRFNETTYVGLWVPYENSTSNKIEWKLIGKLKFKIIGVLPTPHYTRIMVNKTSNLTRYTIEYNDIEKTVTVNDFVKDNFNISVYKINSNLTVEKLNEYSIHVRFPFIISFSNSDINTIFKKLRDYSKNGSIPNNIITPVSMFETDSMISLMTVQVLNKNNWENKIEYYSYLNFIPLFKHYKNMYISTIENGTPIMIQLRPKYNNIDKILNELWSEKIVYSEYPSVTLLVYSNNTSRITNIKFTNLDTIHIDLDHNYLPKNYNYLFFRMIGSKSEISTNEKVRLYIFDPTIFRLLYTKQTLSFTYDGFPFI